jgi:predicted transport protein
MKAIDSPFTKIINGTTQFVIPVFQRDYTWTEASCEQLWTDVIDVARGTPDRRHFLGSVVYVSTGDSTAGFTKWLLIDGQQRVTTLTLLLAALRDHIIETKWTGTPDGPTSKRVEAYFLRNVQEEGQRQHKLQLRRRDQRALHAILDGKAAPADSSERIRENYEFFREMLLSVDPELVYIGINRLVVVDVTLDRITDDPQLIFESLNSTGIDLSQSDLIRNFILMGLPEKEQTRLYEAYWERIERLFQGSERVFDGFIRDYVVLKTEAVKQEKADQVYFAFRRYFNSRNIGGSALEAFLAELLRYAGHYAAFSIGSDLPVALKEPLARLRRLLDVPAILVMRLLACHESGTLTMGELVDAVRALESYVFRRAICGEQTRGYWQVFARLTYQIAEASPLESMSVGLARLHDSYRFPADDEFRKALEERDMYGKRVCFDLLERLENHDNREPSDTSKYSIEHILPQNTKLSLEWRKMLGPDWSSVQSFWMHRLGNLTLTGYNSTYSDRPFDVKKTMENGFSESSVRLNKFVREQSVWTAKEMEKRGKSLARRALTIWPALDVDASAIAAAAERDMRAKAARHEVGAVKMSAEARGLFDVLRARILDIDAGIIEIAELKSITYHRPAFFLEVLPRKHRLNLLLALDFNEVEDPQGIAEDNTQWKFVINAVHEGGVNIRIRDASDIEAAMPMIRQAYSVALA